MNILVFLPPAHRQISTETIIEGLHAMGHNVSVLTLDPESLLHEVLRAKGIASYSLHGQVSGSGATRYYSYVRLLLRFIRQHKVELVFSHLFCNTISVFAQYFTRARFVLYRHYEDYTRNYGNWKGRLGDSITYSLAPKIIAISNGVKSYLIKEEGVPEKKIVVAKLPYDFVKYEGTQDQKVQQLREQLKGRYTLLICGRHVESKKHDVLLSALGRLKKKGLVFNLIVTDTGPLHAQLVEQSEKAGIAETTFFTGFVNYIKDYIELADLVVHPSVSEASNNFIKEAGYFEKPVIACKGVGDFDDYLVHRKNAILMDRDKLEEELLYWIPEVSANRAKFEVLGKQLKEDVVRQFSPQAIMEEYKKHFQL